MATEAPPFARGQADAPDPPDVLDQHIEAGTLAEDRPTTETPDEIAAMVRHWWDRTKARPDWSNAVDQTDRDRITLTGEDPKAPAGQKEDGAEITVNHIYRNAIQTVASLVPDQHSIRFEPREIAEPLPGEPVDPRIVQIKRQSEGLASVLGVLCRRYGEEVQLQETLEAWVQDACHFRIAVLKIAWQGGTDRAMQALGKNRLPDELTKLERFLYLTESLHRGEFTDVDYEWRELEDLGQVLKIDKADIRTGLMVELLSVRDWRTDPRVTGPQNANTADWQRHDTYMTRAEILGKWRNIDPDDLANHGNIYTMDEYGRANLQEARARALPTGQTSNTSGDARSTSGKRDDDLMLVAEIWDQVDRKVRVLVEGLDYPAVEYIPQTPLENFFPFVPLVMNRNPNGLYGFSDTELQAKLQAAVNRMRTGEETARRNARPRYAYDLAVFDPEDVQRIANAEPDELIGLKIHGDDIRKSLLPLVSNHSFHPEEHDTSKLMDEMRRMSGQTEEATGGNGNPEFSSQVQVAAAGANLLGNYRKKRIDRALCAVYDIIAQYLLFNVGQVGAARAAGPMAMKYWPPKPPDRHMLYQAIGVKVVAKIDAGADDQKRIAAISAVLDTAAKNGVKLPVDLLIKLLARIMGEDEIADMLQADPNALVGDLAQAVQQGGPQSLTPDAIKMLTQLVQMLQPQDAPGQPGQPGATPPDPQAVTQALQEMALPANEKKGANIAAQMAQDAANGGQSEPINRPPPPANGAA